MSEIRFQLLTETDFPLLLKWLEEPHVKAWWDQGITWTPELVSKKYALQRPVHAYIILIDDAPIGYIQFYDVKDFVDADRPQCPESVAGLDYYIGESGFLKKGFAPIILQKFLLEQVKPLFAHCLVDPDVKNTSAIRAYEKTGFKAMACPLQDVQWMLVNLKYAAITAWAKEILTGQGYSLQGDCVEVAATPWSSVHRILSDKGSVYLKQTPPALFLESKITPILHAQFPENTPHIIAANKDLHCFLMKDAGQPLREYFKAGFQSELLGCALQKYTEIQSAFAVQVNQFLDLGVPDWRLNKLPALYRQLLNEKDLLIADGLTQSELNKLHELLPKLTSLCEQLASYKIPETLDHCDLHTNNILIETQTKKLTIIDCGEIVITHPFFSLIHCLHDAAYRYILQKTDHAVLEKACFKNWLPFKSKSNLLKAWAIAQKIWPIYSALGEYRLMTSCPPEVFKLLNRKGCLVRGLKAFIEGGRDE